MLTGKRRTDRVRQAVERLLADDEADGTFLPRDVNALLRESNEPMGAWEVRGELSKLERQGVLHCDAVTGRWQQAEQRKIA